MLMRTREGSLQQVRVPGVGAEGQWQAQGIFASRTYVKHLPGDWGCSVFEKAAWQQDPKPFTWGVLEQMELQVDGFEFLPTKIFCGCLHRAKEGKSRRKACA